MHATACAILVGIVAAGAVAKKEAGDMELPTIPTAVERVSDNVSAGAIHGWHSNHLLMYEGALYADARVDDPAAKNKWKCSGAFFRRQGNGMWKKVAAIPYPPYLSLMGPSGRMWMVAPSDYRFAEVQRMKHPLDFGSFEMPYNGTCSYMGAGVSPEGNFLILHAESTQMEAFRPNAVIGAFYDRATDKWHKSRFVTPEGRYGYIGIILKGRKALAVLNSSLRDPKAVPVAPHYTWRHVRLARCDDLTKGEWINKPFLMPRFGDTALQDFVEGPDGHAYLAYSHRTGDSLEEMRRMPMRHYIARVKQDLSADVFATGINAAATRILFDTQGRWFLVGRPAKGGQLHLWRLDPDKSFTPTHEYLLPGTEKLEAYVIHTLQPARFGGQSDGNTIHLLSARYVDAKGQKPASGKKPARAELWYARFDLLLTP